MVIGCFRLSILARIHADLHFSGMRVFLLELSFAWRQVWRCDDLERVYSRKINSIGRTQTNKSCLKNFLPLKRSLGTPLERVDLRWVLWKA